MYQCGMTSYIGAAWRLKRAAMSIATMGAIAATGGQKFIGDPFDNRSGLSEWTILCRYLDT
jgi:hypothetical protein